MQKVLIPIAIFATKEGIKALIRYLERRQAK